MCTAYVWDLLNAQRNFTRPLRPLLYPALSLSADFQVEKLFLLWSALGFALCIDKRIKVMERRVAYTSSGNNDESSPLQRREMAADNFPANGFCVQTRCVSLAEHQDASLPNHLLKQMRDNRSFFSIRAGQAAQSLRISPILECLYGDPREVRGRHKTKRPQNECCYNFT